MMKSENLKSVKTDSKYIRGQRAKCNFMEDCNFDTQKEYEELLEMIELKKGDKMTIDDVIIIIGNLPVNGDECYDITQYQEAKTMAIKALGALQKIIDLDTDDQPMDTWTGIEYVKRIVEEMFGEVGESE